RAVRARTPPGPGPGGAGAGAGSGAGAVRAAARGEPQDLRVVVADLVVELGVDPRDLVLGGAGGGSADQDVVERLGVAVEHVVVPLLGGQLLHRVVQSAAGERGQGVGEPEVVEVAHHHHV